MVQFHLNSIHTRTQTQTQNTHKVWMGALAMPETKRLMYGVRFFGYINPKISSHFSKLQFYNGSVRFDISAIVNANDHANTLQVVNVQKPPTIIANSLYHHHHYHVSSSRSSSSLCPTSANAVVAESFFLVRILVALVRRGISGSMLKKNICCFMHTTHSLG